MQKHLFRLFFYSGSIEVVFYNSFEVWIIDRKEWTETTGNMIRISGSVYRCVLATRAERVLKKR